MYDTQPPGVSAYLPTEALTTLLIIIAIFVLGLRYGPAVATAAIKALVRLFQNTRSPGDNRLHRRPVRRYPPLPRRRLR
ncbi:hypothetical protein ACQI4E_31405 [Streptomyces sp. CA-252508]|uniref:hypothetical protein n=1 Tax=Streptomyces sp. CA-252508 TaxID=3418946 RepID=UPI003D949718